MRRGAAFRRVRARTLRNEESKMCHTSRMALYKLKSARACFGAAFCFGLCLFPTARDRGGAGRPNLNFKLKGDSRDFSLHAPLFFQEKHRQILQRSALDYASMNVHGFQVLAENGDPGGLFFIDFTPAAAAASRAFVRWRQTPEADALRPALPPSTRSA